MATEGSFETAWQAVFGAPTDDAAWDALEEAAREANRVEDAAKCYHEVLLRTDDVAAATFIAERAVAFHDEWVEDEALLTAILSRFLELDPNAQWAFDRISLQLTADGRWGELLALYDRVIGQAEDPERKAVLLEEAAHVAKDSAGKPELAVDYLTRVFNLRPRDAMVAAALERLLKQQQRYRELIDFWDERLNTLTGEDALATLQQVAACWLENLNDPAGALAAVEPLLEDASTVEAACRMLEQILASPASNPDARADALAQLAARYDDTDRWRNVVDALVDAIAHVTDGELAKLHTEVAARLIRHDGLEEAFPHISAIVALDEKAWSPKVLASLLRGGRVTEFAGARTELTQDQARLVLHSAAKLAAERFSDPARAIVVLRCLVDDDLNDAAAVATLAGLYEASGLAGDLLDLRRRELGQAASVEERLSLRIEIARLLRDADDLRSSVTVLADNLREKAGHGPSVRAIVAALEQLEAFGELANLLAEQAEAIETERPSTAADLWVKAADVAEHRIAEGAEQALACYRRAVVLREDPPVLDALARIHTQRSEYAIAVEWLEKRLAVAGPGDRADTILRLASAQIGAGQTEQAVRRLRDGLEEDPANLDMRQLLVGLYRQSGDWEALVAVLEDGAELIPEEAARFELLTEAARIYIQRLAAPERAIKVLESARAINPEDRSIRTQLAEAFRVAGRFDEARELAEGVIVELGRRRAPERAGLHLMLAQIADATGNIEGSLEQLRLAASVDVSNAEVQRCLGVAYRKAGELEKAERAFHALLLILRRQRAAGAAEAEGSIGVAEALYEIHRVARELGDQARAQENLESAFDAAAQSAVESRRFEEMLRESGEGELWMRALRHRLSFATDPMERADLFARLASGLAELLNQPEAAFDAILEAVAIRPAASELHDKARELAARGGGLTRYRETLAGAVKRASDGDDWDLTCDLLVRIGELEEHDLGEFDSAAEHYARAEATGQRLPTVWRAMARVAAQRGDRPGELSTLRKLAELPPGDLEPGDRVELRYRLAELELVFPDTLFAGVASLTAALASAPDHTRAARALRGAFDVAPRDESLIELYERVARNSGDGDLLLDALARRSEVGGVPQDTMEEAFNLAVRRGQDAVAESLLLRAVEVARDEAGDLGQALWAMRHLIQRRRDDFELDDAIHWMREAADVAPPTEARQLLMDLAAIAAGSLGNLELAADTYEALLDDTPGDQNVWHPALEIVRRLGDRDRHERLLTKVSEAVTDPQVRNQLRIAKARLLLAGADRMDAAIATLEQVLDDDPEHLVAGELLADLLEKSGREEDLATLLERQIDMACEKRNADAGVRLTLRLGALLARDRRDEARTAYRSVLEWVPDSSRVLEALLALLDPDSDSQERADVLERLVEQHVKKVLEDPLSAGPSMELAIALVHARDRQGDPAGMERALEHAFRINPRNSEIIGEYRRLAERLFEEAFRIEQKDDAVELLQKAASIHWTRLDDMTAAAGILREAHSMQPSNVGLVSKLVRCLVETGKVPAAIDTVTETLERHPAGDAQRVRLLRLRANVRATAGQHAGTVEDLEEAISLGGDGLGQELCDALRLAQAAAAGSGDQLLARSFTMRLAKALRTHLGAEEQAREVVASWVNANPLDHDAIYALLDLDSAAGRWEDVALGYSRLVKLEEGEAQTDAAVFMADAFEKAGTPEAARGTLESLYKIDTTNARIRARLRRLYEKTEAFRDLSNLIIVEANQTSDDDLRYNLLRQAGELRMYQLNAAATAIGPLMEALDMRPNDESLIVLLSEAYTIAGFADDAVQLLRTAVERHGDKRSKDLGALQHRMARALAATGDSEGELKWLQAAWESYPQSGEMASELAERAMELKNWDLALKALRALAAMRTPAPISRPLALFRQAEIAEIQEDSRKAAFLAKKAFAEDPSLKAAEEFLARLKA
ncbi:MAG: hypothetical protein JW751_17195 [Polyangiaceae bacterium]|nr:hypothetical protein [Polyangiaceae bacterium]